MGQAAAKAVRAKRKVISNQCVSNQSGQFAEAFSHASVLITDY
jgi:hypothetical protein